MVRAMLLERCDQQPGSSSSSHFTVTGHKKTSPVFVRQLWGDWFEDDLKNMLIEHLLIKNNRIIHDDRE